MASPSPGRGVAPLRESATCGNSFGRTGARPDARNYTPEGTVNGSLHAFLRDLHLYEAVAVVLIAAAAGFLAYLALKPGKPYVRARNLR